MQQALCIKVGVVQHKNETFFTAISHPAFFRAL